MKSLDTAKTTTMVRIISFMVKLAHWAVLFFEWIISFTIELISTYYIHQPNPKLRYPHVQKRVIHRYLHNRKHSLFAVSPDVAGTTSGKWEQDSPLMKNVSGEVRQRTTLN